MYDEWNLLAEIAVIPGTNQKKLLRTYAWGPDISGTRQGAGGVAGLLIVKQYLATGGFKYLAPTYDANGNIMAYYDLETKQAAYRFEYDAFGREITFEAGPSGSQPSEAPPFRFSTKYTDGEIGLVYYGFRYYQPETGRWLSRDPIAEKGGLNLYGMVGNDAVNRWDLLGLAELEITIIPFLEQDLAGNKIHDGGEDRIRDQVKKLPNDSIREVLDIFDANKQLKECDCIKTLNIEGHGNVGIQFVGSVKNPNKFSDSMLEHRGPDFKPWEDKTGRKADGGYGGFGLFKGLKFCKPCQIVLRGCLVGKDKVFVQAVANATGCRAGAFTGATNRCSGGHSGVGGNENPDVWKNPEGPANLEPYLR